MNKHMTLPLLIFIAVILTGCGIQSKMEDSDNITGELYAQSDANAASSTPGLLTADEFINTYRSICTDEAYQIDASYDSNMPVIEVESKAYYRIKFKQPVTIELFLNQERNGIIEAVISQNESYRSDFKAIANIAIHASLILTGEDADINEVLDSLDIDKLFIEGILNSRAHFAGKKLFITCELNVFYMTISIEYLNDF